jgi:hypothetical protein
MLNNDANIRKPRKTVTLPHCVALPFFTLKSILRQKKNYENSNISVPCKNIIFKKNYLKATKILQDIIITLKFSQVLCGHSGYLSREKKTHRNS